MNKIILYISFFVFSASSVNTAEISEESVSKSWKSYYGPSGGRILSIAITPSDTKILYAATMNALYKTTEAANSWQKIMDKPSHGMGSIAVHPKKPETIVSAGNKLEISEDGGKTWRDFPKDDSFKNVYVNSICYAGKDKIVLIALSSDKVFRYEEQDGAWKQIYKIKTDKNYGNFELTADARNPSVISVKSSYMPRSVDFSFDAGDTWRHFPVPGEGQLRAFGVHPQKEDILIYVIENGVAYFSSDKGDSWEVFFHPGDDAYSKESIINAVRAVSPNFPKSRFHGYSAGNKFAVAPDDSQIVYYASYAGGIQKTTDGGNTWQFSHEGIIATDIKRIFSPSNEPGSISCSSSLGTYVFNKDKSKWIAVEPAQMQDAYYMGGGILAIDPNNKSRFVIGDGMGRTFISEDKGENWSRFSNFEHPNVYNRIFEYIFYPDKKDMCLAVAASGIYECNFKTGDTTQISEFLNEVNENTWGLVALFNSKDMKTVFVTHNSWGSKCKYSTDTGKTWKEIKMPFSPQMGEIPAFDILPDGSILGISNRDIWKMSVGSQEWQKMEGPQKNAQLKTIAVSKSKNDLFYVADSERKVWITEDSGKSWKNLGRLDDDITFLFEHPADGNLFAGTQSSGVMIYSDKKNNEENKSE